MSLLDEMIQATVEAQAGTQHDGNPRFTRVAMTEVFFERLKDASSAMLPRNHRKYGEPNVFMGLAIEIDNSVDDFEFRP